MTHKFLFLQTLLLALYFLAVSSVAAQSEGACTGFTTRLAAGMTAVVLPGDPNILRAQPETGEASQRIGQIPAGSTVTIIDGPSCGSGYTWWLVDFEGLIGWTAEGPVGTYWLEPIGSIPSGGAAPSNGSTLNLPPDILEGISFGGGGGPGGVIACENMNAPIGYHVISDREYRYEYYASGATITPTLSQVNTIGTCMPNRVDPSTIYVITPLQLRLTTEDFNGVGVFVGEQDYPYFDFSDWWCTPGIYEFHVESFVLYIQLNDPFTLIDRPSMLPDCLGGDLVGFAPNEHVRFIENSPDSLPISEHQANNNGTVPLDEYGIPYAAVSETGRVYIADIGLASFRFDGYDCRIPYDQMLFEAIWQATRLQAIAWRCVGLEGIFVGTEVNAPDRALFVRGYPNFSGFLSPGTSETWSYYGLAGEEVSIRINAEWDTTLAIYAPDGTLLAFNDDDPEGFGGLNSVLAVTLPIEGVYRVEVRAYADNASGAYELSMHYQLHFN